ncbi:MAG: gatC [Gammaproteobacteria bacterium]|jgi:aspartyl-tRNA(Asn)/glutamyl-tRNA(Gln) amidotransferase subunit C|nr:gatC [Gammaproteobacteria bacterium]
MTLTADDIKKIAHLARLNLVEEDIAFYTKQLSSIFNFVEQINQVDTGDIEPLTHSHHRSQRLRLDVVTEHNQRTAFQAIAPQVEAGLYLVPQVIEGEE